MCKYKKILITFLVYISTFLLICLVGISKVFGYTYQDLGYLSSNATVNVQTNYYQGLLNLPKDTYLQLSDVFSIDVFVSNISWQANNTYEIELNLVGTTLNSNANSFTVINYLSNGEETCINEPGTIYEGNYPRFAFKCPHNINSFYLRIYNSEMNYILPNGEFRWNYVFGRLRTSSDTQDIINNDNQNTQNIINNFNNNTQNIINNQNQNTQQQIESQQVCSFIDKSYIIEDYYLTTSGNKISNKTYGLTDYIEIKKSTLKVLTFNNSPTASTCFYDNQKSLISCYSNISLELNEFVNIPNNSYYFRTSINTNNNTPQFEICTNGNQAIDDTLNDDDSSEATSEASDFFSSFDTDTFGLTSIITAPLNLIQSVLSSSCTELNLPLPYLDNKYLNLPCMSSIYSQYFGTFFTIYQTITYGIVAYWVVVRIFNMVKDFKNPEHDEIEVMDL